MGEKQIPELMKLADFIEHEVEDKQFDMRNYFRGKNYSYRDYNEVGVPVTFLQECGTAACAAGWARVLFNLGCNDNFREFLGLTGNESMYITCRYWPSCRKSAAERIRRVGRGERIPDSDAGYNYDRGW